MNFILFIKNISPFLPELAQIPWLILSILTSQRADHIWKMYAIYHPLRILDILEVQQFAVCPFWKTLNTEVPRKTGNFVFPRECQCFPRSVFVHIYRTSLLNKGFITCSMRDKADIPERVRHLAYWGCQSVFRIRLTVSLRGATYKRDVIRDDSQRRFLAQQSVAMLERCCNHSKQCCNIVFANRLV